MHSATQYYIWNLIFFDGFPGSTEKARIGKKRNNPNTPIVAKTFDPAIS
ncbi:MAG: hypothetical protein ACI8ZB_003660 [Desulforhopalus sp.]|jgi:hypothetical protein